jgi:hypothetical protein
MDDWNQAAQGGIYARLISCLPVVIARQGGANAMTVLAVD